ncbi:MAG: MFS transporter [Nitrososphaerales archaeon]
MSHLKITSLRASLSRAYVFRIAPLYFAVFIMRFSFSFTVVALQFLVANPFDRGVVSAAYPFMEMSSALFLGVLVDKIGRKWVIVTALLCSSFITFSFTLTKIIGLLILIHALQGICASAIVIATLALLTDVSKLSNRGREMGAYDFFTISGYGIGFVFAAFLIGGNPNEAYLPFYLGASVALAGSVILALILKDSKVTLPQTFSIGSNLRKITSNPSTLSLVLTWFVLMTIIGVALTYTRELMSLLLLGQPNPIFGFGLTHANLKVDGAKIAFLIAGVAIVALSQTSFGSLSDRFGRRKIALIGQVSLVGMLFTLIAMILTSLNRIFFFPLLGIFGLGLLAFAPAALAELADSAPESGRGSTMGLYSLTVGAGTIFGPLAGGALLAHYGPMIGLSSLFGFLAIIMIGILIPRFLKRKS